ncbi:MAG: hypothetical protein V5A27_11745 [Halapricum sp.]
MGDTLTCPECGNEIESMEHLETAHEVTEVEPQEDGSFNLFEKNDLFLCKNCRKPLGVGKRE